MFNNWGGDGVYGPSQLLMLDVADGAKTTIFPSDRAPNHLRGLYILHSGHVSISPDRR